ncbi:hypothetical protein D3C72_2194560 [compost metagenome]
MSDVYLPGLLMLNCSPSPVRMIGSPWVTNVRPCATAGLGGEATEGVETGGLGLGGVTGGCDVGTTGREGGDGGWDVGTGGRGG